MKALILVGGFGTRLRPLTLTRPKPLVEFCNKPILLHQIEALANHGVKTIILAVSYMGSMLKVKIKEFSEQHNLKIILSMEEEPLGTAGPLALARSYLEGDEPFFVLNSDVICEYPFTDLLNFHHQKGAEGTIVITPVNDPSKYGVVVADENGRVERFVEKPPVFVSNKINAGIYILNTSVLDRIELRPTSIEKEVFPLIAKDRKLYAFHLQGFWMDIGQPTDYLTGSLLFLKHLREKRSEVHANQLTGVHNTSLIHPTAVIGSDCLIEESVVGESVVIGNGVCLKKCVIFSEAVIQSNSLIKNSLIGWRCNIGRWVKGFLNF